MKKIIFNILISALSITANCQISFANVTCPTLNDLKNATFSTGIKIANHPTTTGNSNTSEWIIITDDFNAGGNKWNLWYIFLTSATNQAQAIEDGTNKFNQIKLNQPTPDIERDKIFCNYIPDKNTEIVSAYSPPQPAPTPEMVEQSHSRALQHPERYQRTRQQFHPD